MSTDGSMSHPWHMAVLIPARDEEALLPRCLRSVRVAAALLPSSVTCDIVVVSDSSVDGTVRVAREALTHTRGIVVEGFSGSVGRTRALAAREALRRCSGAHHRCWLANTDADCEVPATWLLDQWIIASSGYAGVVGVVDVDSFAEHLPMVEARFRATYTIHPDGTHPHVHGANLGVRADAYLSAGGWGALSTAEDHDLWNRLRASKGNYLADARLQVLTSGRRVGRAPLGFADALGRHNEVEAAVAAA